MKKSSIELKQYAPTWTQSLTVVVFTVATVFVGNLSAEDKNSGIESTNFCQGTAGQAFTSCKSAARSDYQVALGNALTSLTRQHGHCARDKPRPIWLMGLIRAREDSRCDRRVVKNSALTATTHLSIRLTSPPR